MIVDRKAADALYRVNFGAFAYAAYEVVHPHEPLCPNWHIDCICHHLAAMEAGRLPTRFIVNLPPRSLKSYLVSVAWVACASGMGLIQLLKEQTQLPVIGQHSTDNKETRLARHEGRFEAGRILLPTEAPWLADFENELLAFPSGRYDDQVDALMLCLDWFAKNEYCLPPSDWPAPILFRIPRPGPY